MTQMEYSVVIVRAATKEDSGTIYDLIIGLAQYHDQAQYVATSKAEIAVAAFGEQVAFGVLLAEIDGQVAGFTSYTWNYSIWQGQRYMNIDDVFVLEAFRGQKIGQALMLKAKEVCLAKGAGRIRWEVEQDNTSAIAFYRQLGATLDIKGVFHWDVTEK